MKKLLIPLLAVMVSLPLYNNYVHAGIKSKIAGAIGTSLIIRSLNGGKTGNEDPKTGKTSFPAEKKWIKDQALDQVLPNFPAMRDAVGKIYGDPEQINKAMRKQLGVPW